MTLPAAYIAFDNNAVSPIAQSAAGYDGATATLIYTGPTTVGYAVDVTITIIPTDTTTDGNFVRPFHELNSIRTPWGLGQYKVPLQTKRANEPWQKPITIGPIRLVGNATAQKVYFNQEKNDTSLIAYVKVDKFQL